MEQLPSQGRPRLRARNIGGFVTFFQRLVFCLFALAWGSCLQGQDSISFDPLKGIPVSFSRGAVVLQIPEKVHLKTAFMKVVLKSGTGTLAMGKLPKPTGQDELGDAIWHGTVSVPVSGTGLTGQVELEVTYQPCTEGEGGVCFPPTRQLLKVAAKDIPVLKADVAKGSPAPKPTPAPAVPVVPSAAPQPPASEGGGSALWILCLFFLGGMSASLTPCVLPMIPITMAIIGARGASKGRGLLLGFLLTQGMAVTYTTLGVLAARSGGAFGAFAQKPEFLIPVSLIFGLFALSLFGAFEIKLPDALANKLQSSGPRKGVLGAFVMGLILGPLSAPCVGPLIGTAILDIAAKGQVLEGAVKMFIFAQGMGVLFMVGGVAVSALPKSGDWLTRFKQFLGLLVFGYAVWNVRFLVPDWANYGLLTIVSLTAGAVFGAFEAGVGLLGSLRQGLALLALALALLLGIKTVEAGLDVKLLPQAGAAVERPKTSFWMEQDLEGALAKAKAEGKVVLVDIYAEWCAQCHELDEKTWPDQAIQAWVKDQAIAVRIDTDKVRPDLAAKLQIRSYPTVLILDGEGKELRRILGFQKPPKMLGFLKG